MYLSTSASLMNTLADHSKSNSKYLVEHQQCAGRLTSYKLIKRKIVVRVNGGGEQEQKTVPKRFPFQGCRRGRLCRLNRRFMTVAFCKIRFVPAASLRHCLFGAGAIRLSKA